MTKQRSEVSKISQKNNPSNQQQLSNNKDVSMSKMPPQMVAQQKLQGYINSSPLITRMAQFQQMADNMVSQKKQVPIIQRAVGLKNFNRVYVADHLKPAQQEAQNRYQTSVNALTGRNDTLHFVDSDGFKDVIHKNIEQKTKNNLLYKNKYVDKKATSKLIADALKAQSNSRLGPEERQAITDKLGKDLEGYENTAYARNSKAINELNDPKALYLYNSDKLLEEYDEPQGQLLLAPEDMHDAPGNLPQNKVDNQTCAIQTLSDLQADVNSMWGDLNSATSVNAWHNACYTKGLDYRNDNEYIKILKKLNYTLVSNSPIVYSQMDWTTVGDGKFFLGTGDGGIGHAYGVTVTNGAVTTIHDRQNLHGDNDIIKYIFKK